jgi:hypothetical protein
LDQFADAAATARSFCIRSDDDDWKRCLVCGIFWYSEGLCVNTAQLKLLIGKSKSSINGALAKMGFEQVPVTYARDGDLMQTMPFLAERPAVAKQWTMRKAPKKAEVIDRKQKTAEEIAETQEILQPCVYGCFCGCNCKPPGEITTIPCLCDLLDSGLTEGDDPCHCASSLGIGH